MRFAYTSINNRLNMEIEFESKFALFIFCYIIYRYYIYFNNTALYYESRS